MNQVIELFLSDFYKIESILHLSNSDSKSVFYELGNIYLFSKEELDGIYEKSNHYKVKEITTYNDYKRYLRVLKYYELNHIESDIDEETLKYVLVKGNALSSELIAYFEEKNCYIPSNIYDILVSFSDEGKVESLRLLGMILSLGIVFDQNLNKGQNLLSKAAKWNDIASILTILSLNDEFQKYLPLLKVATSNTPYELLLDKALTKFGLTEINLDENAMLVNKAFEKATIKRNTFNSQYERIIYSDSISLEDKQKVILSNNNELISLVNELPLKLKKSNEKYDLFNKENTKEEIDIIKNMLINSDLRAFDNYKPICFVSNSNYLIKKYMNLINKIASNSNVKILDVSTFISYDVESTNNNVFVRNCNENKDNIYLLLMNQSMNNKVFEYVKPFLNSSKRKEFRLSNPKITINLKDIMLVCFANYENAKYLQDVCEMVYLNKIKEDEKDDIIHEVINHKIKQYSLKNILLDKEVFDKFLSLDVDDVDATIDKFVQKNRVKDEELHMTLTDVKNLLNKSNLDFRSYGFGGVKNETK